MATKSGILAALTRRGAAGLVVAALAVGGGGVVAAAATGSINPGGLGQRVAQIVEGCKDTVRGVDQDKRPDAEVDSQAASAARKNNRGIGKCVSSQVNDHQNGAAHQDTVPQSSRSSSPGKSADHGQGSGAAPVGTPPGQGGPEHGRGSGSSGDHGHPPTPSPHT